MARRYGYARVGSPDQAQVLHQQRKALKAAGCTMIRAEQIDGATPHGKRPELSRLLAFVGEGDVVTVTRLDRLASSIKDLQDIVRLLEKKGASLAVTEQQIDTGGASGRVFAEMLATFAQFESGLRRERQLEGIARAKAEGKYKGRKPVDPQKIAEVERLVAEGAPVAKACSQAGVGRSTYYREVGKVDPREKEERPG